MKKWTIVFIHLLTIHFYLLLYYFKGIPQSASPPAPFNKGANMLYVFHQTPIERVCALRLSAENMFGL